MVASGAEDFGSVFRVGTEDAREKKSIPNDDSQAGGYHVKSTNNKNQKLINVCAKTGEFNKRDDVTEIMFNDIWTIESQP